MLDSQPRQDALPFAEDRSRRKALFIVFLVVFIDLLGFGIVLPLLPLYATELLQPLMDGEEKRALRGAVLGMLMAVFSLMQFIFAPVWGRISDRVGRRPILLLGLAGSVVFYSLFGIASEIGARGNPGLGLALMFLARIGAGVAGATISTAQAVIADSTPPERRARGMALIGAAFGIGFTFGPLLGLASLFLDFDGAPGFAAAAFSLTALLLAVWLLPETLRGGGSGYGRRNWFDWRGFQTVLQTPAIGILVLTFFLATLAFGGLESTLALANKLMLTGTVEAHQELTRAELKTTERKNFLVFAYVGLVLMLTQGLVYRRLVQRVGEVPFMRLGVALMAIGLGVAVGILAVRESVTYQVLLLSAAGVMTIAVIGFAFLTPSAQSLISRRSDPTKQGEILGVNQSASALARILGPLAGITLFFLTPSHQLPYIGGAALMALVFVLSLRVQPD